MMRYPAGMNVSQILEQLIQERDQIEEAILSLERLAAGRGRRRGRPPAWLSNFKEAATTASDKPKRRRAPSKKPASKRPPESES